MPLEFETDASCTWHMGYQDDFYYKMPVEGFIEDKIIRFSSGAFTISPNQKNIDRNHHLLNLYLEP